MRACVRTCACVRVCRGVRAIARTMVYACGYVRVAVPPRLRQHRKQDVEDELRTVKKKLEESQEVIAAVQVRLRESEALREDACQQERDMRTVKEQLESHKSRLEAEAKDREASTVDSRVVDGLRQRIRELEENLKSDGLANDRISTGLREEYETRESKERARLEEYEREISELSRRAAAARSDYGELMGVNRDLQKQVELLSEQLGRVGGDAQAEEGRKTNKSGRGLEEEGRPTSSRMSVSFSAIRALAARYASPPIHALVNSRTR
eukprot:GHVU01074369.1.p1 GENE.GHVU01074369.1~~GHVU01074369.1.p1  ORF type:complete len:267 (+),score=45.29 GHVU01074369.1:328-1128(+)